MLWHHRVKDLSFNSQGILDNAYSHPLRFRPGLPHEPISHYTRQPPNPHFKAPKKLAEKIGIFSFPESAQEKGLTKRGSPVTVKDKCSVLNG